MTENIKIEYKGLKEINRTIQKMSKKIINLRKPLVKASVVMEDEINKTMQLEGRPKWSELRPYTIALRTEKGHWPGKIGQDSGRMKRSLSSNIRSDSFETGFGVPYAKQFQEGAPRQAPRPLIHLFEDTQNKMIDIFQKAIFEGI